MDITPSGALADECVVIGGEVQKETYKEISKRNGYV
jgi:hypothetical protein